MLENKIALVTGGTSGIGLATARRLLKSGATVILSGRSLLRLAEAERLLGSGAYAIAADLANPIDIDSLLREVATVSGGLDVLVINAGVSDGPAADALDADRFAALMDVNCRGAALCFARALPLLRPGASVVFVGSVAGRKGQPGDALYAGSKGFIRAFARSLGTDPTLLDRGIRVNVVSPGPIDTPLTEAARVNPEVDAFVRKLVPMGRWGRAEEVAEAILFLASSQASFTTGADLTVDGGMAHA